MKKNVKSFAFPMMVFVFYIVWALMWTWIFHSQEKPEQVRVCRRAKKQVIAYKVNLNGDPNGNIIRYNSTAGRNYIS